MSILYPSADNLTNEEVDYEIQLRGRSKEAETLDLQGKQRLLRKLFKDDQAEGRQYPPPYTFAQEADFIENRLQQLLGLAGDKLDLRTESRLRHYYFRLNRHQGADSNEESRRLQMKKEICRVLKKPSKSSETLTTGDEEQFHSAVAFERSNSKELPKEVDQSKGAIPKSFVEQDTRPSYDDLVRRIQELESLLTRARVEDQPTQELNCSRQNRQPNREGPQPNSLAFEIPRFSNHGRGNFPQHEGDSDSSDAGQQSNLRQSFPQGFRDRSRRFPRGSDTSLQSRFSTQGREREYRQYRRIENWKISFSGDGKSSVEDFLFKLKIIADREGVSDHALLRDVHLVLEGRASDWFFTYIEEISTWEQFEAKIRYRFGNPNQDQGIRQKIHERKQFRGESFIAFVTEIERLNKMLSRPMSRRDKFQVIWENMRHHYQSKLSVIEVVNLEHLIEVNHRIDAADMNLHSHLESRNQRQIHNVEHGYSDNNDSGTEEIDVIRTRPFNNHSGINQNTSRLDRQQQPDQVRTRPYNNQPGTNQNSSRPDRQPQSDQVKQILCWNCKKLGHGWRECSETKVVFCYGCGELGRTIRNCPRCGFNGNNPNFARPGNQ